MTPRELAQELGLSVVRINGLLHELYPRTEEQRYARWDLSREQVDAVRRRVGLGRAGAAPAGPRALGQPAQEAWFWEGNVQTAIATHLANAGWQIIRVAATGTKERGDDILARKARRDLVVEVKGYPADVYADPRRAGEVKVAPATLQAHHWLADGVIHVLRILGTRQDTEVALGLPRVVRYERLLAELEPSLRRLGVGVYLVTEGGAVDQHLAPARPSP